MIFIKCSCRASLYKRYVQCCKQQSHEQFVYYQNLDICILGCHIISDSHAYQQTKSMSLRLLDKSMTVFSVLMLLMASEVTSSVTGDAPALGTWPRHSGLGRTLWWWAACWRATTRAVARSRSRTTGLRWSCSTACHPQLPWRSTPGGWLSIGQFYPWMCEPCCAWTLNFDQGEWGEDCGGALSGRRQQDHPGRAGRHQVRTRGIMDYRKYQLFFSCTSKISCSGRRAPTRVPVNWRRCPRGQPSSGSASSSMRCSAGVSVSESLLISIITMLIMPSYPAETSSPPNQANGSNKRKHSDTDSNNGTH